MAIQLTPVPAERFTEWSRDARERLIARAHDSRLRTGADAVAYADRYFAELIPHGEPTPATLVLQVRDGGRALGSLWLAVAGGKLFVIDLELSSPVDDDELFAEIVGIARERGVRRITIALFPGDAAGHALIAGRGFQLASIQMLLEPLPQRAHGDAVTVEPMTPERFPSYAAASEAAFAEDLIASGRYTREQAVAESRRQMDLELPDGIETAGQSFFTASVDGTEVGILWIGARLRDDRPHGFVLDIEVADSQRRKGYGRALMLAAEREARDFGAESLGLHVFGFNTGAIELYEGLGYSRVEESFHLDL